MVVSFSVDVITGADALITEETRLEGALFPARAQRLGHFAVFSCLNYLPQSSAGLDRSLTDGGGSEGSADRRYALNGARFATSLAPISPRTGPLVSSATAATLLRPSTRTNSKRQASVTPLRLCRSNPRQPMIRPTLSCHRAGCLRLFISNLPGLVDLSEPSCASSTVALLLVFVRTHSRQPSDCRTFLNAKK
jgi:hypothetical protein